jgi:hypothetical protein
VPKRLAVVASAIALVLAPTALVACGGDDSDSGSKQAASGKSGGEQKLEKGATLTL